MKTQMQFANRAWRKNTKSLEWHRGWKGGLKSWRRFCRENAAVTVDCQEELFSCQEDADESVTIELSYWD